MSGKILNSILIILTRLVPYFRLRLLQEKRVDSKLVSVVRDLESEAERILREANDQAATIRRDSESSSARLAEQKHTASRREAEDLRRRSHTKTQEDLEQSRAREKAALGALLHRAETRLEKAVQLILEKLGKF